MLQGQFCFIKDDFFQKYDGFGNLMQNKHLANGGPGGRPCFFVFDDSQVDAIKWCIPLSSQIEKYEGLREHKLSRLRAQGVKNPVCREICFGKVLHRDQAFLVQSMFPVTEKYIDGYWMDGAGNYVTLNPKTASFIVNAAQMQLKRHSKGNKCFWADIDGIKRSLIQELMQEGKLRVEPGAAAVKQTFIPKPTAYTLPTEAERYIPSPPRENTFASYAAEIVRETGKAIAARRNAQQKNGMKNRTSREKG